jgi:hypothetical protein
VTWLLQACVPSVEGVPVTTDLARQMLVGDRDYLVLQLWRLTLGDDVHAVIVCPACGNKMDADFRISDVQVEFRPQTSSVLSEKLADRAVRFRLPTGGDQEAALERGIADAADEMFQRCLVDDGGRPPSPEEQQAIIGAMEHAAPLVDLELDLTCPECGHQFLQPLDTTSYFFDALNVDSKQLLHEIHALALYYHWSEADILSLRRDRRREYLGLLHESLSRQI